MSRELVERLRYAVVDDPNYGLALRMSLQAEDVREAADLIERQSKIIDELAAEGQFLTDRLSEFESEIGEKHAYREYAGHAHPSIARLRLLIKKSNAND